ncbi:hypothetical protein AVEN_192795-1 [Araneus ventricosus]|uniref:Uncharacterized protein n=1 Tax=Araneus ventricosus TaxID=182803 RepID=A0A4Y2Q4L5_ARAVE|nr:hypothetical protein AVEN_192795-1 [Araneus ventricosus]
MGFSLRSHFSHTTGVVEEMGMAGLSSLPLVSLMTTLSFSSPLSERNRPKSITNCKLHGLLGVRVINIPTGRSARGSWVRPPLLYVIPLTHTRSVRFEFDGHEHDTKIFYQSWGYLRVRVIMCRCPSTVVEGGEGKDLLIRRVYWKARIP